jgi:hypothetical protein
VILSRPATLIATATIALAVAACSNEAATPVAGEVAPPAPAAAPASAQAGAPTGSADAAETAVSPATEAAVAPPAPTVAAELQATIGQGIALAVSLSSNPQAHEYAGLLATVTGEMLATNPDACARLLNPAQFGTIGWDEFPPAHRERFVALQQAMIAAARNAPTPAPGEDEAGPLMDAVYDKLVAAHGKQILAQLQETSDRAAVCRSWHQLHAALAAESVDDGGRVMRWLNAP